MLMSDQLLTSLSYGDLRIQVRFRCKGVGTQLAATLPGIISTCSVFDQYISAATWRLKDQRHAMKPS